MAGTKARGRLLVLHGSFDFLGGAERDLLVNLPTWLDRWEVTVASLNIPPSIKSLLFGMGCDVTHPTKPVHFPHGGISEITASADKVARKGWRSLWKVAAEGCLPLSELVESVDAVHVVSTNGALEAVDLIPNSILVHIQYHEPPRGLFEDVLHLDLEGKPKRCLTLTRLLLSYQRRRHLRLIKRALSRPKLTLTGNSRFSATAAARIHQLKPPDGLENGQKPERDGSGRQTQAGIMYPAVVPKRWMSDSDQSEREAFNAIRERLPSDYVVTVGRAGWAKGTLDTIRAVSGSDLGVVLVGGASAKDLELLSTTADDYEVEFHHLSQVNDAGLVAVMRFARAVVSLARGEPFGLTPVEAMLLGTPALFVNEGGFCDTIVDGETGRLLPRPELVGDTAQMEWLKALEEANDVDTRTRWAKAGRERVLGKFTTSHQVEALSCLLSE